MRMLIVLVGLAALADVAVSLYPDYPYCCPEGKDTWCFTCYAPMDDCCIAVGIPKKCAADETCYHYTDAHGHSYRGCKPYNHCPYPPVYCAPGEKSCLECRCEDPKFTTDVQNRNVSQCEWPGYEYPWCIAWCYGDPHIGTCDGFKYSMSAVDCCHVFIRSNCTNGTADGEPPYFSVAIYLDPTTTLKRGLIAKAAKIIYRNAKLYVDPNIDTYEFDGVVVNKTVWPDVRYRGTSIRETFFEVISILCFEFIPDGFRVYWDYRGGMSVWIPNKPEYKGHMCGLAGDCDGDPSNDLVCGPSDVVDDKCPFLANPPCTEGTTVSVHDTFTLGMSWYTHNTESQVCNEACHYWPV